MSLGLHMHLPLDSRLSEELVAKLGLVESLYGSSLVLTSTYRDGDPLSHGDGDAADIACSDSFSRFHLLQAVLAAGFTRVVVYPRHIHVDVSGRLPSPVLALGEYHG